MRYAFLAASAFALALAAGGCAHQDQPAAFADGATRGIYDADYAQTTEHFDTALKLQVTRSAIGQLSDRMHALGAYRGLKQTSASAEAGRYEYEASFDKGTMLVEIRLDPTGKIGAYRVVPATTSPSRPRSSG